MRLYHATYKANLVSIFENGLGAIQRKNWDISTDGGVCFADDMDLAISFCEAAENVDDEVFESGIVCLEIDSDALSEAFLFLDPNFDDVRDGPACYLYRGVIAPADLKVCWEEHIDDSKEVNNMIVDLILDRKDNALDGVGLEEKAKYNAHDFYMACMSYGRIADDITKAMDGGTEEDVQAALCKYISDNEYNPLLVAYICRLNWLCKSDPIIEEAAAAAFDEACARCGSTEMLDVDAIFDEKLCFVSDKEKMVDFGILSKDEFLASYSYLTKEEYDATARVVTRCFGRAVGDFNELEEKLRSLSADKGLREICDLLGGHNYSGEGFFDLNYGCLCVTIRENEAGCIYLEDTGIELWDDNGGKLLVADASVDFLKKSVDAVNSLDLIISNAFERSYGSHQNKSEKTEIEKE